MPSGIALPRWNQGTTAPVSRGAGKLYLPGGGVREMSQMTRRVTTPPRIERLKVQNFRTLQNIEFKNLTPLAVLLGPNGSGKSTVFDVFAFLAECFGNGLRRAWEKRGRARELKSREADGSLRIEIAYRE